MTMTVMMTAVVIEWRTMTEIVHDSATQTVTFYRSGTKCCVFTYNQLERFNVLSQIRSIIRPIIDTLSKVLTDI